MRYVSFLFLFILCFISEPAHSYTVVLKTGKAMEGTLISDTGDTLQFKGQDGIFISFKKSVLDYEAMSDQNKPVEKSKPLPPPKQQKPSLVDLAKLSKSRRTGNARLLTEREISALPEITILGSTNPEVLKLTRDGTGLPDSSERYWRKSAQVLKKQLNAAREKKEQAASSCARSRGQLFRQPARGRKNEIPVLEVSAEPAECVKANEKSRTLQDLERQWDDFSERARRGGVPWQWLE